MLYAHEIDDAREIGQEVGLGTDRVAQDMTLADEAASVTRVVIVDDDPELRELLAEFLSDHGMGVEAVGSGAAMRALFERQSYDLVVLDVMMPGEDGLSVLRSLAAMPNPPGIIMFSALSAEIDRVVALEMGADDYVLKPSSPREILARLRSVLRRRQLIPAELAAQIAPSVAERPADPVPTEQFGFAGWVLDCRMMVLHAPGGEPVPITAGEYKMMNAFVRNPQVIHSRDEMAVIAGKLDGSSKDRTIDVNISRLRRKLAHYDTVELIRTVRNEGYMFLPAIDPA